MPEVELAPGVTQFYRDDDLTDPWKESEAVMLLHGNAESSLSWNGWMPFIGRRFRVIRPDTRGYGRSTPMPVDHPWSLDELVADFVRIADHAGVERFHLIAAKIAGPMAIRLAATHPARVRTLTLIGTRARGADTLSGGKAVADIRALIAERGVASWARSTMGGRLGSDASAEMREGWVQLMGATAVSTVVGFHRSVPSFDASGDLTRVAAPALVVTTEGSGLGSIDEMRAMQQAIPRAELAILSGDSYHISASDPRRCSQAVLQFIEGAAAIESRS